MLIQLDTALNNQADLLRKLYWLSQDQITHACAAALNDTGFAVRRAMQAEMHSAFDRPTAYMLRSPIVRRATPERMGVIIEPAYLGGKGLDPQKIIQAQTFGGSRRDKRSEAALRRAGILPSGYQTAIPDRPLSGTDDGHGNLKGSFLAQLISYFQASAEQGYRANMTAKRRAQLAKGPDGRRYIVAYGRLRGSARIARSTGEPDRRPSNLAPGIWALMGPGGVDVRPVLMFVRAGRYSPRFTMERVEARVGVQAHLERRLRYRLRQAAGV